jgi:hypothetical protein
MRQCSRLTAATLAIGLIGFATTSQAATTITAVKVTIGPLTPNADPAATATYCSQGAPATPGPTCDVFVWDLGAGGVSLTPGDKLILTQNGTLASGEPNFDTSDRFKSGTFMICASGSQCATDIWINSGAGLTLVYTNHTAGGDPLTMFNQDGFDDRYEAADWQAPVFSSAAYTLSLGYADTEHKPCQVTSHDNGDCLPQAQWWETPTTIGSPGSMTRFIGSGIISTGCKPRTGSANCYDGGALLITVPQPTNLVTVTQGGWGAPPHGNNPGQLLVTNFAAVFGVGGVTIGCGTHELKFTSAAKVQAFLPQGGPPGVLPQGVQVDPTSRTSAGVFAGQVLALTLNVAFSNAGKLPTGLASAKITSGPLAGQTVGFVLNLANNVIGGCTTLPASGVTSVSQLNDIVDAINNSFD